MTDLAKRAVACKGWRWKGGELAHVGRNPVRVNDAIAKTWNRTLDQGAHLPLPDLTDAATLGCLLALVREAWGDQYLSPRWVVEESGKVTCFITCLRHDDWEMRRVVACGPTEAAALVAALGAAP